MLKDAKIHFFGILWLLFWRKKVAIAGLISLFKPFHVGLPQVSESMSFPCLVSLASTGMSSLWEQVGKGMGSMLGEAVQIRLILLEPTFYRLTTSNLRFPCSRTYQSRNDIGG